ncbi:hypothetical protein C1645_768810 [Glomus cerebriforme]|uniref:Uncharacterized protein n=1 Tax=Glomus cerebriforme TaxID=658196 RepID=A0A397T3P0_9GLOM|nr:hypothetical protein C1645_768810 [Glomus cerebriforme]
MQTSIIATVITIPQNIEVGKLKNHNLKSIGDKTGTFIFVNKNKNPAQIEINYDASSLPPSNNRINEAKKLLNNLIENEKKLYCLEEKKKKKNVVGFLDEFNKYGSNKKYVSKYHKEVSVKKEKQRSKQEINSTIKSYMEGNWEDEPDGYETDEYY